MALEVIGDLCKREVAEAGSFDCVEDDVRPGADELRITAFVNNRKQTFGCQNLGPAKVLPKKLNKFFEMNGRSWDLRTSAKSS
jgi:hypothetical protein